MILEAVLGYLYGLDYADFRHILRGCDHPVSVLKNKKFTRTLDPKGFWRFEQDIDPELRLSVLAQVAYQELGDQGLERFLAMNGGEGWRLPEALRLADYDLGHDDRRNDPQPVGSKLQPRFYQWQEGQSVEESWEECERHAEILAKILPPPEEEDTLDSESDAAVALDLFGNPVETDLLGSPVYPKPRKR